ncbi:hypothetical protein LT330_001900 [Penicillium expansum]|uniref:Uncharacterized protein n=1 Tax=Penicillium expansum TaxID=27334 RepID=A0A0A2J4B0_PENEN|nr:hypothetical protein PEX2_027820 [Penicillium expansum]KAJ5505422.1 hypothetical protein N7453_004379 [Penicillium expansum]KAK4865277.1 hypothetical protein LT330_001900 [Penicillium expansum]KGO48812.1 hypothetical protein PEXP_009050 [Penicillium expansum]KGO50217.1 hypothetical protein PEX2_027820 [Penicillium expansum]KGO61622.1 hypothetical protein PEX1_008080 [Penicillium expansum]
MKFFNVILVAALAALANAAAMPNPEAALDINPLEKRCKGAHSPCISAKDCCNGACVSGGTINKFIKYCN